MMRKLIKLTCLVLILLMLANTITASAAEGFSGEKALKIGAITVVVVGVVCLIRQAVVNGRADKFYQQGEALAAAGDWEGAVRAYTQAWEINPNYKDVTTKLATAKERAGAMFLRLGDEARKEERLEAAEDYYRKALQYMPASTEVRQKLDQLAQELALVYYRRGLAYETVNRWPEALREYERAYLLAPQHNEIVDHYQRAQTKVHRDLPLIAILFFVNNTDLPGLEDLVARELETRMVAEANGKYVMLDYNRVQAVVNEQAAGLSATLDERLAMDLGRLLGVDEVIIGVLDPVEAKNQLKIKVAAQRLEVPSGKISKEVKAFTYNFPKGMASVDWWRHIPQLASQLSKRLKK
ncbi:MAG TPA: tetratricopeptide repeat protein [Firmicutes bacterium]|jgi:tetratricopeptide (TPR) repeat protein|nr:tetratricopeptide repeat protein [Bacillota bacterium]